MQDLVASLSAHLDPGLNFLPWNVAKPLFLTKTIVTCSAFSNLEYKKVRA